MTKKLLVVVVAVVLTVVVLIFFDGPVVTTEPAYQSEKYEPPIATSGIGPRESAVITAEQARCGTITSFQANLTAKLYQRLTIRLTGRLTYERPRRCVLVIDSRAGRESELGSNEEEFWFYSRRMDRPGLYFARHEDLPRTNLKAPFHPGWIAQAVSLEPLVVPAAAVCDWQGDALRLTTTETGPAGQSVTRVVLIDAAAAFAKGHYLYSGGSLVASLEVTERGQYGGVLVPRRCRLVWIDRGTRYVMEIDFEGVQLNTPINATWTKPTRYGPGISLTRD